jgi:hypothetical protein
MGKTTFIVGHPWWGHVRATLACGARPTRRPATAHMGGDPGRWVLVQSQTLIGLDFPLAALVGIAKRSKILTCT